MNTLGIICTAIGTIIAILAGVWAIFDKIFKMGKTSQRIDNMETSISELKTSIMDLKSYLLLKQMESNKTIRK